MGHYMKIIIRLS